MPAARSMAPKLRKFIDVAAPVLRADLVRLADLIG
jgi:hypothetical protein